MKNTGKATATPIEQRVRRSTLVTVICDVVLIALLVMCLLLYISRNNTSTYKQNVDNITGISTASSRLIQTALDNTSYEVKSVYKYCNGKSITEILDYLSLIIDEDSEYQLLTRDEDTSTELFHVYNGYSTKKINGVYQTLQYKDTALARSLHNYAAPDDGTASFTQSFTNKTDALRYFAAFCSVSVRDDNGFSKYYLVKPQKEARILNQLQIYTQYENVSLAICYTDGKYLACDNGFRADNFYDYLYNYNGLSIDERNEIRASVQNNPEGKGILNYHNYQGEDCVFAYTTFNDAEEWFVIVSVPLSDFVSEQLLSLFPLIIITFLAGMMVFNIWRLLVMVKELRQSVVRERIANEAKSSFLSRMSHEIRTPLNAVIGYNSISQSLIGKAKDDIERKQLEMRIMDCMVKSEIASKHLLTIINDVLDMSAIEGGKIAISHERFDFKGLITSLTTIFYTQAQKNGVDFEVAFDTLTDEWFVGDQMRVNQILTNLLSNAIKFTPSGGSVTLNINQPDAVNDAAHIRFTVTDTGIGMTQEYLNHIWTPFEQEDSSISRRFGGSGLGLSITKSIVDLMGGSISVNSKQGVGTTFVVDLTFEKTEAPHMADSYDFSSVNALVVDDDVNTCDYIRLLFNRSGAKCATVTSGADAIKAVSVAKEQGEMYSVCLVDWRMPQMDGCETVKGIRDIVGDDMPIIVLTAYDYSELAADADNLGVDRFLSKPLFQSSLFDLLASINGIQSSAPIQKNESFDFNGARILLAEDNAMNMEIAKTIMESAGLVIDCANNGSEAVEIFKASEPGTYKAILMDIHMPVMNGHDATRSIRSSDHQEAKTIPIIAMTADAFAENVAEARVAGMNDHISKPIDIPTLFRTLKKHMR